MERVPRWGMEAATVRAGAKANIDPGNCAENDTEEGAEDQGTGGEFGTGLGGGNEGFEGGFAGCGCCHVVRLPACSKLFRLGWECISGGTVGVYGFR